MLATPQTPDYIGTLRHECPRCHRAASVRRLIRRDADWNTVSDVDYCEWIGCGWEKTR